MSKARKEKLDAFAAGAALVKRSGYALDQLRVRATLDRVGFAGAVLDSAEAAMNAKPPMHRVAVSRSYYAMYHALRAASFFVFGGDDHEKHLELPSKIPADFPSRAIWENTLKAARFERNRADYDPYPKSDFGFSKVAVQLIIDAQTLLPVVKAYLKTKGCIR